MRPKSYYRHMTPAKAADIRRRYFAREGTQLALAREHGVSQNTVSRIVSGQSWNASGLGLPPSSDGT